MTSEQNNPIKPEEQEVAQNINNLQKLLQTERGDSYAVPKFFMSGGTRHLARVRWGPHKDEVRVAKFDKKPISPRAIRHVQRGYTTAHELELASRIQHPGVTKLLDYFPADITARYGLEGSVTIEEDYTDSQSLEEIVRENLSEREVRQIFDGVISTIRDINNGIGVSGEMSLYHRDLKPSNILVKRTADGIKVKITDWANSSEKDKCERKYNPTAGGIQTTDPLLMSQLIGEEGVYNAGSEVYSLASNLALAIRGKPIFELDPDNNRAIDLDTGDSLLNEQGMLDRKKYERALERAVKKIPRKFRKYSYLVKSGLTLTPDRFSSVDSFYNQFRFESNQPSLTSRLKKWGIAATAAAIVGGLGVNYYLSTRNKDVLEGKLYEEQIRASTQDRVSVIKREYSYTDTMDALARKRLRMWLEKFCEFDKEKYDYKGDKRTAFACYIETIWDRKLADKDNEDKKFGDNRPPITVYTAIQMAGGKTDYNILEPIIEKLNPDLYWAVKEATSSSIDSFARGYLPDETEKRVRDDLWKNAKQGYENRKAEEEKVKEMKEKNSKIKSAMMGDLDKSVDQQKADELRVEPYKNWRYIRK